MKVAPTSSQTMRFAAVALFIAMPIMLAAIATLNLLQIVAERTVITETEAQTATLLDRLRKKPSTDVEAEFATFVAGATGTSAIANLQQTVLDAILSASGKVIETAALAEPAAQDDVTDRIGVTTTLDIDNDGLLQLLYALEAGTPLIWVDTISIRSLPDDTAAPSRSLRVEMTVSAHWLRSAK